MPTNDNWRTTLIGGIITGNQVRDIINSGYAPSDGRESAIIADLPPGNYTAICARRKRHDRGWSRGSVRSGPIGKVRRLRLLLTSTGL